MVEYEASVYLDLMTLLEAKAWTMSLSTGGSHGSNNTTQNVKPFLAAELTRRLSAVYRNPMQERIQYLEGKLVELMQEVESVKTDNERLNADLDERDTLLSKCRADLIQSYETSMQTRADMLELLQTLQDCDLAGKDKKVDD